MHGAKSSRIPRAPWLLCLAPGSFGRALAPALLLFVACGPAFALDPHKAITQYTRQDWDTKDGLPQESVQAIAQTPDGYLWLGTMGGLVRFDGARFTVFTQANSGLPYDNVWSLCVDHSGRLWIGTDGGGVALYEDGRFKTFSARQELTNDVARPLLAARDGSIWVGTNGGGLNHYKDGRWSALTTRDGLSSGFIWALAEDGTGGLWIGTHGGGAQVWRDGKFTTYGRKDGLPAEGVFALATTRNGDVWMGTREGVVRLRGARFRTWTSEDGLPGDFVRAIREDRDGNVWVGTTTGIARFRGESPEALPKGQESDSVRTLAEDREGNLWVGLNGSGLSRLGDGKFLTLGLHEGLPHDNTTALVEAQDGSLWIGLNGGGLCRYQGGQLTTFTQADGLPSLYIFNLADDRRGGLWIGTLGDGLAHWEAGRVRRYTRQDGLPSDYVRALLLDRLGRLWAGTQNGLGCFEGGSWRIYGRDEGVPGSFVRALSEAPDGSLWCGTPEGLARFENGAWKRHGQATHPALGSVYTISPDPGGSLWVGTSGGLRHLEGERWTDFAAAGGMFAATIYQILEDGQQNFWMSCGQGIFSARRRDLEAFVRGQRSDIPHTTYDRGDGMRSTQCNGSYQPAGWKTRDGRLWFPTVMGLVAIDPAHIRTNTIPPPVMIEQLVVDGSVVPAGAGSTVGPGPRRFEFHYTGLSFAAPEKVRFRFKLDGFDGDWLDAGTRRVAYYTRIPPGSYTFRVQACNNDGVWNEAGASLSFQVAPYFYQRRWFGLLLAGGAVLGGLALHRLRVRRLQARFSAVLAERTRIARDLHDTLDQGLTAVGIQMKTAARCLEVAPEQAGASLGVAQRFLEEVFKESRRAVWALRSQALEGAGLLDALTRLAHELTSGSAVQVQVAQEGQAQLLPAETESQVLRIGQEALTNAIRHAAPQSVCLTLRFEPERFTLTVRDDGRGFDPVAAQASGRFGVLGMQERAQRVKGALTIESQPGRGSEVTLALPLPRSSGD